MPSSKKAARQKFNAELISLIDRYAEQKRKDGE